MDPQIPQTSQTSAESAHYVSKILFGFFVVVIGAVVGYGSVYSYVYYDLGSRFSISALKGQIVSEKQSAEIQQQLKGLGFEIDSSDFHDLNAESSSHYKSSVLNSFEPGKTEAPKEKSFYFYDKNGAAYYCSLDQEGKVSMDLCTALNVE